MTKKFIEQNTIPETHKPSELTIRNEYLEMIEAGAEIIRGEKYDLAAAELAQQVYLAMAAVSAAPMRRDVLEKPAPKRT